MRIPRVFIPIDLTLQREIDLPADQSHYLNKVLRLKQGDLITVFNGEGGEFSATIHQIDKKVVSILLADYRAVDNESPLALHLGIGISRGERMDLVIQKSTELGVTSITPLFTERCEVKLTGERSTKKIQHWQQIAISACEQSQRNRIPQMHEPVSLATWLSKVPSDLNFVLHHRTDCQLQAITEQPKSIALLVGPEGGLSADEIALTEANGFKALALGPRVLRTETAPLAAISILQHRWGDM